MSHLCLFPCFNQNVNGAALTRSGFVLFLTKSCKKSWTRDLQMIEDETKVRSLTTFYFKMKMSKKILSLF